MKILTSVFTDAVWTLPAGEVDRLQRLFPQYQVVDAPSRESRRQHLPDADVAFLSRLGPEEFAEARRLRWIQSPAAGVAGLLSPALRASDVLLSNARGIHGDAMAEHVIALAIVLFRQIHLAIRRQASHVWGQESVGAFRTLRGRRMGIVGLGAIGSVIAERAAALGMEVVAVRRNVAAARPPCVSAVYGSADLHRLLAGADVVVLAAPATSETRGLIGLDELRAMKADAILINVARGRLIREADLVQALSAGVIAGAALDVFEREPLDPSSPLWDLPNVVITPHTSAIRNDYWTMAVDLFAANLRRFEAHERLLNLVDKEAGY